MPEKSMTLPLKVFTDQARPPAFDRLLCDALENRGSFEFAVRDDCVELTSAAASDDGDRIELVAAVREPFLGICEDAVINTFAPFALSLSGMKMNHRAIHTLAKSDKSGAEFFSRNLVRHVLRRGQAKIANAPVIPQSQAATTVYRHFHKLYLWGIRAYVPEDAFHEELVFERLYANLFLSSLTFRWARLNADAQAMRIRAAQGTRSAPARDSFVEAAVRDLMATRASVLEACC
jgi:hypothetical protein